MVGGNLNRFLLGLHVHKGNMKAREIYSNCYHFKACGEEDGYYRMLLDIGQP